METVVFICLCFTLLQNPTFGFKCIKDTLAPDENGEGYVHSPNYPRVYPAYVCYIWYHEVDWTTKVVIEIQDLDIPSSDNCQSNSSNRLIIGPYEKHHYCGRLVSDVKYEAFTTDYFYIVFIINETNVAQGRGFLLHYKLRSTEYPRDKQCFYATSDASGVITIPRAIIFNKVPHSVERKTCSWLLQTPNSLGSQRTSPMYRYTLRFQHFHFYPDCCALDIYEGSNDQGRLIGHYFSSSHPHSLYALGPFVFMRLSFNNDRYFGNFTILFQRKEICLSGYSACSYNESGCYPTNKRCDGIWDCPLKGGDERGCTATCSEHKFSCGNKSAYCYFEKDRCNGKGSCANYRDEQNCTPSQCSLEKGLFLCRNKRCIFEKWTCDHSNDCGDGSDEEDCNSLSSPRLIMACVVGTLISSLLLVLAVSFAFKVYALRMRRRHRVPMTRHDSPLSRIEQDLIRRRAPPPQYNEAMMTSRSYDEAYLELLNQGQDTSQTSENPPTQESGGTASGNPPSNAGSRRSRGRCGNRRRDRNRHLHRNLRIQQLQHQHQLQHIPPPLPLHYFTEQPPSYSDSAETSPPQSSSLENHPVISSDFSTSDGRSHELQPLSTVATSSSEPVPPPYSLHNELPSTSGSEEDDDDDDELDDEEEDIYVNDFSSSRRDADDSCLLTGGNEDDDEEEEDDTCLSIRIPAELDGSHHIPLSFTTTPSNTNLDPVLMMSTELGQVSNIKEDTEDDDDGGDNDNGDNDNKKDTEVEKDDGNECSLPPRDDNIADCSPKADGTQCADNTARRLGVPEQLKEDDDDDECILNGDVAVEETDYNDDTCSDTACLLAR